MRTIRDMVGIKVDKFVDPDYIQYVVDTYNNTPHLAYKNYFSPIEAQDDYEIEAAYIDYQKQNLGIIIDKQQKANLFNYDEGDILLAHIDLSKTPYRFDKRRRIFNELVEFVEYKNGNVICHPLDRATYGPRAIEIPIFYTKYLCDSRRNIPRDYRKVFYIRNEE
jgi:hypothetical protein